MTNLLSMPVHLRNNNVGKLLDAAFADRASPDYAERFCAAYEAAFQGHPSKTIRSLLNKARAGDLSAVETLWVKFLNLAVTNTSPLRIGEITNIRRDDAAPEADSHDIEDRLRNARSTEASVRAEAPEELFHYLERLVDEYKETKLFWGQLKAPQLSEENSSGRPVVSALDPLDGDSTDSGVASPDSGDLWAEWDRLVANIGGAAERLWRDVFLQYGSKVPDVKGSKAPGALVNAVKYSHRLMLLRLEARLYRERSYYNSHGRELVATGSIRVQIREMVGSYRAAIKAWSAELAEGTGDTYFQERGLESQQLRRLIQQFSNLDQHELGWASQASEVEAELRYQTREEVRREMSATGHPGAALFMTVLRVTTGYGTRPLNFVRTALELWLGAALAFFLNDAIVARVYPIGKACAVSQPHIQQWSDWIGVIGSGLARYLYISATTLTTLGADTGLAAYSCGGVSTELILVLSTISGYFMLGLLAALLYAQLTQRA
jgi:hypothetical protein